MKEALKKALVDGLREHIEKAREASIFTNKGRVFLDACALEHDAAVNSDGQIIKSDGTIMSKDDTEYKTIVEKAMQQARAQSSIGGNILGS